MTVQDVLRKAAAEIGYYAPDDPLPGSKYGRWEAAKLGQSWLAGPSRSIWWCVIFGSWVYDGLATVPGLPGYNTTHTLAAARAAGAVLADPRQALPGDVVIFDWDKSTAVTNHFGIVEINAGNHLQTIEGNTSGSDGAHQSDGNGVWRRTRGWDVVAGIIRPTFVDVATSPVPTPIPVAVPTSTPAGPVMIAPGVPAPSYPLPKGYYFGWLSGPKESISGYLNHRSDLRRWQQRMKDRGWTIEADGHYGSETAGVAHNFQVEKHLGIDSLIGPETWGAAWTAPVTRN